MTRRWLAGLLLVGFLMRLSGILWGVPLIDAGYYHPDEPKVIRGACSFPRDVVERTDLDHTARHDQSSPAQKAARPAAASAWALVIHQCP